MGVRAAVQVSALVVAVGATAGCGSAQAVPVRDVAAAFHRALAASAGQGGCALLAPTTVSEVEQSSGKPCARGVLGEGVPAVSGRGSVHVFGTMAQVRYAGDVTFLARFGAGWKVLAAACTPQGEQPYDCAIKGSCERVRTMFLVYLGVIVVGLGYLLVVGLRNG